VPGAQSQKKDLEDREQELAAARAATATATATATAAPPQAGGADAAELAALQEQVDELKWEADDRIKEVERLQVRACTLVRLYASTLHAAAPPLLPACGGVSTALSCPSNLVL
jgi:hypothetical protein